MRDGELQRLQPVDIDLEADWNHIVSRHGLETKKRRPRKVPLHPRLRPLLEKLPGGEAVAVHVAAEPEVPGR
jgi:integrase